MSLKRSSAWRYRLFSYLPGHRGAYYAEKFGRVMVEELFSEAVEQSEGTVCIDLGANVGEYTRLLARRADKVISFEPDPWSFSQLKKATADLSNVELINAAVGTKTGSVMLFRHKDFGEEKLINSQSSSVLKQKQNVSTADAIEVEQIDFLAFLRTLEGDVGILKVDIEGAEVELLEALFKDDALLSKIHYIFVETHERIIPEHVERVAALRRFAHRCSSPVINLYWH